MQGYLRAIKRQCLVAGHQLGPHWHQSVPATELQKPVFCFYERRWCRVSLLCLAGYFHILKLDYTEHNRVYFLLILSSLDHCAQADQQKAAECWGRKDEDLMLRINKDEDVQVTQLLVNRLLPHSFCISVTEFKI